MSYGALCATNTLSARKSSSIGTAAASRGASATIEEVMPVSTVMNAGMGCSGSTNVRNSPRTSPARTFTAPISVILPSVGLPPVVSRSTTQNVVSTKGVPSKSRLSWAAP